MAFRERFKDKVQVVGKDGAAHHGNAEQPPPQAPKPLPKAGRRSAPSTPPTAGPISSSTTGYAIGSAAPQSSQQQQQHTTSATRRGAPPPTGTSLPDVAVVTPAPSTTTTPPRPEAAPPIPAPPQPLSSLIPPSSAGSSDVSEVRSTRPPRNPSEPRRTQPQQAKPAQQQGRPAGRTASVDRGTYSNNGSGPSSSSTTSHPHQNKPLPPAPLKDGKPPSYVPYDIASYRKMKDTPIHRGGLGANETDEVIAAREMRDRARQYAQSNNRVNMVVLAAAAGGGGASTDDSTTATTKKPIAPQPSAEQLEALERRNKALEFAKRVPKPTTKTSGADSSSPPQTKGGLSRTDDEEDALSKNDRLAQLEAQHRRDQDMVAAMRRQMGGMPMQPR